MTTSNILTALIAIIAVGIAYFQLETNRDKLRLDLYNRRFEIYTKILDLYFELLNFKSIKEPSKEDIVAFKRVMGSFFKYQSESRFLFKEDSGVFSILEAIYRNIWTIIAYIEHHEEWQHFQVEIKTEQFNKYNMAWSSFDGDIGRLNEAMKPYLDFHDKTCFENMLQKFCRCHPKLGKNKSA